MGTIEVAGVRYKANITVGSLKLPESRLVADLLLQRVDAEGWKDAIVTKRETLISRNGDLYSFLTNEERDINKEIKQVDLSGGDEAKLLGTILFEDVLKGQRKTGNVVYQPLPSNLGRSSDVAAGAV